MNQIPMRSNFIIFGGTISKLDEQKLTISGEDLQVLLFAIYQITALLPLFIFLRRIAAAPNLPLMGKIPLALLGVFIFYILSTLVPMQKTATFDFEQKTLTLTDTFFVRFSKTKAEFVVPFENLHSHTNFYSRKWERISFSSSQVMNIQLGVNWTYYGNEQKKNKLYQALAKHLTLVMDRNGHAWHVDQNGQPTTPFQIPYRNENTPSNIDIWSRRLFGSVHHLFAGKA